MRLGVFHQKMQQTDWVNNQHSKEILDRLLKKYGRFLDVVADNPGRLVVPTLDVDLAWHTHMLSPKTYAAASIRKTGTLLDHPDKIDEDKLSMAFAWTCKIYAEKYGQSYSDCACWYCESVRAMSGELPNTKDLPWSPTAQAAHISAHPSVRALETASQRERTRVLRQEHQTQLLEAHAQILRDARSSRPRTRDVPSGGATVRGADRVDVWGREVQVEGPAASVLAVTTTAAMYAVPPGVGEWPDGEDAGAVGDDGSLSTG
ncbi:hypothetical protein PLIIFM63780_000457 [Purpureocillium lilacinum]|nr:hypothetical protein PLICBS_003401 [Purpureocillium lilacinum]GJN76969.1 hypothetical protein PLIIFM63780_000457 [Purpureocillium lilacinum]